MTLRRYNEVVGAILLTLALLGALAGGVAFLVSLNSPKGQPPGVVVQTENKAKPKQALVFCPPWVVENSEFEYFPVAAVVQDNADQNPTISPYSISTSQGYASARTTSADCLYGGMIGYSRVFNVVIRGTAPGSERLLLAQPAQIESLTKPAPHCKEGQGDLPCGLLLWKIRPADSNQDGVINRADALVAYVSGLAGNDLRPITPPDATVLSSSWLSKSNRLVFVVQRDTNNDKKFSNEDGSAILETDASKPAGAVPAFGEAVMKRLQSTVLQ